MTAHEKLCQNKYPGLFMTVFIHSDKKIAAWWARLAREKWSKAEFAEEITFFREKCPSLGIFANKKVGNWKN